MSQDVVNAMSDLKTNVSFSRGRGGGGSGNSQRSNRGPSWESTGRQPTTPSLRQTFTRCLNQTLGRAGADVVGNPDNAKQVMQAGLPCGIVAVTRQLW